MVAINPKITPAYSTRIDKAVISEEKNQEVSKVETQNFNQPTTQESLVQVPLANLQLNAGINVGLKDLPEAETSRVHRIKPDELPNALNPDKPYKIGDVIRVKDKENGYITNYKIVSVSKDLNGNYTYKYEISFK